MWVSQASFAHHSSPRRRCFAVQTAWYQKSDATCSKASASGWTADWAGDIGVAPSNRVATPSLSSRIRNPRPKAVPAARGSATESASISSTAKNAKSTSTPPAKSTRRSDP